MDWEPHPVARPSAMFSASNNNIAGGTGPSAHSRGFLASACKDSPFMFHTSAMQLDEPEKSDITPVASTSTSQPADHLPSSTTTVPETEAESARTQTRDIANGAVQRERRKRDQLKSWQVAKGKGVQVEDDNPDDNDEDTVDEVDTSFMESLSISAPIKSLLVSVSCLYACFCAK